MHTYIHICIYIYTHIYVGIHIWFGCVWQWRIYPDNSFFHGKNMINFFLIGMGWRVEISELMPVVETCLVTSVLCEESEFVSWQFTGKESRTRYFVLHLEFGVRLSDSFASFHLPADDWCLGTRTMRTNRFLDDIWSEYTFFFKRGYIWLHTHIYDYIY